MINKLHDSNKENMTPSSVTSMSNNNYLDNCTKIFKENRNKLLTEYERLDEDYFKLLRRKEELSSLILDKDSALLRDKAELEFLGDCLREIEGRIKNENEQSKTNASLERNMIQFEVVQNSSTSAEIKLKGDMSISGLNRNRNEYCIQSINHTQDDAVNEILEREYNKESDLVVLYAAFNII